MMGCLPLVPSGRSTCSTTSSTGPSDGAYLVVKLGEGLEEGRIGRRDVVHGVVVPDPLVSRQTAQRLSIGDDDTAAHGDPSTRVVLGGSCRKSRLCDLRFRYSHVVVLDRPFERPTRSLRDES